MAPPAKPKGRRLKSVAMPHGTSRELVHRPTLRGWTPSRVNRASDAADAGVMQELSDLVETIFTDDRVTGVLSTRTHGLLGLPIDFVGGSMTARRYLAGQTNGTPGEWWRMHDESELAKLLRWGLTLGVGLAQRIPLPRVVGQPQRYRLETWSPRWLSYYHQGNGGTHWRVITQDGQKPLVPGDGEWILFQPYGARRPWAEGLWKAVYFPWLLKHFSQEDRANFSEVMGSPIWVGTTTAGSTEKQRGKFLSQLRGLGKNGKIVLPQGWEFKLVEAASSGKSGDVFSQQIKDANESITIALAGQLVTTEGTPGFSSGNIHDAIKQDLIRFDAERLSTTLREQSLEPWAAMNYGSSGVAPWPQWQTEKPEAMDEKASSLKAIGDAVTALDGALRSHGLKVNAEEIMARFNVPVLRAPAAAPAVSPGVANDAG